MAQSSSSSRSSSSSQPSLWVTGVVDSPFRSQILAALTASSTDNQSVGLHVISVSPTKASFSQFADATAPSIKLLWILHEGDPTTSVVESWQDHFQKSHLPLVLVRILESKTLQNNESLKSMIDRDIAAFNLIKKNSALLAEQLEDKELVWASSRENTEPSVSPFQNLVNAELHSIIAPKLHRFLTGNAFSSKAGLSLSYSLEARLAPVWKTQVAASFQRSCLDNGFKLLQTQITDIRIIVMLAEDFKTSPRILAKQGPYSEQLAYIVILVERDRAFPDLSVQTAALSANNINYELCIINTQNPQQLPAVVECAVRNAKQVHRTFVMTKNRLLKETWDVNAATIDQRIADSIKSIQNVKLDR